MRANHCHGISAEAPSVTNESGKPKGGSLTRRQRAEAVKPQSMGATLSALEESGLEERSYANLFPTARIESAASKCVSTHVVDATPLEASATFTETALGLYTAGRHRVRRKQGARLVEGWSDPGMGGCPRTA